MSYYQIIDGVKYDRSLLELAERHREGRGEGRISFDEANELFQAAADGPRITHTEIRTLQYLLDTVPFTDKAAVWLREKLAGLAPADTVSPREIIINEFDLSGLIPEFADEEVEKQNAASPVVKFAAAFREALNDFITDGSQPESPKDLVKNVHMEIDPASFPSAKEYERAIEAKIKDYMRAGGVVRLVPLDYENMNEDDHTVNPPENREPSRENWIFALTLPTLSDHLYWAIVDRKGKKETYNYGFN